MDEVEYALASMSRRLCGSIPHAPHGATVGAVWRAFLTPMDCLRPDARAAYLLHEGFGIGYAQMARVLGCSASSCRLPVAHARHHLHDLRPR